MARNTAAARVTWLCVLLAMVACFGAGAQASRSLLQANSTCAEPPLPDVNIPAFAGVWYQIGSTALMKTASEQNLACTTTRFTVIDSGANLNGIRVRYDAYNASSGDFYTVIGLASVTGRKLAITFPGGLVSDFRVIYLSGTAADRYKTSVIYSCTGIAGGFQSLTIYSRDPTLDDDETVAGLIEFARTKGITLEPSNQFITTSQDGYTCGRT